MFSLPWRHYFVLLKDYLIIWSFSWTWPSSMILFITLRLNIRRYHSFYSTVYRKIQRNDRPLLEFINIEEGGPPLELNIKGSHPQDFINWIGFDSRFYQIEKTIPQSPTRRCGCLAYQKSIVAAAHKRGYGPPLGTSENLERRVW